MADIKRDLNLQRATKAAEIQAIELPKELKAKLATPTLSRGSGFRTKPNPEAPPRHFDVIIGPYHFDGIRTPSPVERYVPIQIQGVLDKRDIADLAKHECVIEKNTLYIPETRVVEVSSILKAERFAPLLKK